MFYFRISFQNIIQNILHISYTIIYHVWHVVSSTIGTLLVLAVQELNNNNNTRTHQEMRDSEREPFYDDIARTYFKILKNKHYCILSNSGLSNATSRRPKLAFFRGKICPPQSQNCQNQILHISEINFYFGFRCYSRYNQCRLVLNLFEFLWRSVKKHSKRNWETGKNRNSHISIIVCILLVCLINNRHLAF